MRHCKACGITKPFVQFYSGVLSRCKDCHRMAVRANRASRAEHYKAYDRTRSKQPARAAKAAVRTRQWQMQHPQKRAAQIALGNAVRDGRVVPWPVCAMPDCHGRPEAHHPDYSQPLAVVWLCPSHHKQAHALIRRAA